MGRYSKYESASSFEFCLKCGTKVECIDSRAAIGYRRRRWRCPKCLDKFTTREMRLEDWENLRIAHELPEAARFLIKQLGDIIARTDQPVEEDPKRRGRPRKKAINLEA